MGVIANSALIHPEFYEEGKDLRIIARWGVGYEKVNLDVATQHGVIVTVSSEHMDTVAEYAIAQWMATMKRVYTLNRMSHSGDYSLIRTYEAKGSSLGLYGFGRIGQAVASRAKPLLGDEGRSRLGSNAHLLRLSDKTLETPENLHSLRGSTRLARWFRSARPGSRGRD